MKQRDAVIASVFQVSNREINDTIKVTGAGPKVVQHVRSQYPRFTRIVLKGHFIDKQFIPVDLS